MKNITNIYDIDDKLIRSAGDNHKFSIDETKKMIDYYRDKLKECGENDSKAPIYTTYISNLSAYLMKLYQNLTSEQLYDEIKEIQPGSTEEQIQKAMIELKEEIEKEENDGTTEGGTSTEIPGESIPGNNESNIDEKLGDDVLIERGDSNLSEAEIEPESGVLEPTETIMDEYVDFEEINDAVQ